jgi:hypothetical protein
VGLGSKPSEKPVERLFVFPYVGFYHSLDFSVVFGLLGACSTIPMDKSGRVLRCFGRRPAVRMSLFAPQPSQVCYKNL